MRGRNPEAASGAGNHIRGLDGIRACAFLLVLAGHSGFTWIPNGFGVTVFFFLSGYLITTLLRKEWIRTGRVSIPRFYVRRAFRILPPLYCALTFALIMAAIGLTSSDVHWKGVLAVQLFLSNYSEVLLGAAVPAGLSVLWSLAVEEHFYLVFPWMYKEFLKLRMNRLRQVLFLCALCLLILVWRLVLVQGFHVSWYRVYSFTDTRLDSILFGSILAIGANPAIDRLDKVTRRQYAVAAFIGLVILLGSIAVRGEAFRQTFRYTIQGIALFPVFIYVIKYSDSVVTRLLEFRPLVHIGDLSYSLYVFHYTILFSLAEHVKGSPLKMFLMTLCCTYLVALFMRYCVEVPANRMRNRMLEAFPPDMVLQGSTISDRDYVPQ